MLRLLPAAAALAVILGTGVIHGLWTQRWEPSGEVETAALRLERGPGDLGPWKARPGRRDPDAFRQAGAAGDWVRTYTHETSRQTILVIVLCGPGGPMSVHGPEHCYMGAGYAMTGPAVRRRVPSTRGAALAEFWTARFRKQRAAGPEDLRIDWSWFTGDAWVAPDSPRLTLAHFRVLYKLYVVRTLANSGERLAEDPSADLLGRLVPALTKALSRP
jgi:hypothetical protein